MENTTESCTPRAAEVELTDLPPELLLAILSQLPYPLRDLPSAAATCSAFAGALASDDVVWRLHLCAKLGVDPDAPAFAEGAAAGQRPWRRMLHAYRAQPASLVCHRDAKNLVLDGLSARFSGRLGRDRAVRTDVPLPRARFPALRTHGGRQCVDLTSLPYFEVTIGAADAAASGEADGAAPCVSVGLSTRSFSLRAKQTGWTINSIGYHGDDGYIFHGAGLGLSKIGPRFGAGDTVGCGVELSSRAVFFTCNGKWVGASFRLPAGLSVYPTVGIDAHQALSLNFGRQAFAFDLAGELPRRLEAAMGEGAGALPEAFPAAAWQLEHGAGSDESDEPGSTDGGEDEESESEGSDEYDEFGVPYHEYYDDDDGHYAADGSHDVPYPDEYGEDDDPPSALMAFLGPVGVAHQVGQAPVQLGTLGTLGSDAVVAGGGAGGGEGAAGGDPADEGQAAGPAYYY